MPELLKPAAVLFDWDGTLVDSFESIVAANNAVRAHFGEDPYTAEDVMRIVQIGNAREIFGKIYGDPVIAQQALDIYYKNIPVLRREKLSFIPGAAQLIETLLAAEIPLGVVSNMAHGPLLDEIAHVDWTNKFKVVVGAGEAPRGKPDPAPVYLALERLGLSRWDAPDVWFVGDMVTDQRAAEAAGCPFIFYTGGIAPDDHKQKLPADLRLQDYDELTVMVKKLLETQ